LEVVKHGGENLSQGDEGKEESILNKAKENKNNEAENEGLYLMTKLPDEENVEMMLLDYFNMRGKQSMVALLGARMDGDNYGEL
ncbi:UPF0182 family protein, partial [Acinetobacter baumannii]|nr:UPF0182 family protein [Acinetobacter baumannii]